MNTKKADWVFQKKPILNQKIINRPKRFHTQLSQQRSNKDKQLINIHCAHQKKYEKHINKFINSQDKKKSSQKILIQVKQDIDAKNQNIIQKRIQTQPNLSNYCHNQCQQHNNQCFCVDCDCGRHLCNFKSTIQKPHITMKTTYQNSFSNTYVNKIYNQNNQNRAHKITNQQNQKQDNIDIVKKASKSIPIPSQPYLSKQTIYQSNFKNSNKDDLLDFNPEIQNLLRPQNQLKQDPLAPAQQTTTYSTSFIGHKGANQYVKKVQNFIGKPIAFRATSSYKKDFIQRIAQKYNCSFNKRVSEKEKQINKMINRSICFSSYQNSFYNYLDDNGPKQKTKKDGIQAVKLKPRYMTLQDNYFKPQRPYTPNQQDFAFVSSQKVSRNHKSLSTYHRQFQIREGKVYCPARMKIRNINGNKMYEVKRKCKDNTNFKQFLDCVTQF